MGLGLGPVVSILGDRMLRGSLLVARSMSEPRSQPQSHAQPGREVFHVIPTVVDDRNTFSFPLPLGGGTIVIGNDDGDVGPGCFIILSSILLSSMTPCSAAATATAMATVFLTLSHR